MGTHHTRAKLVVALAIAGAIAGCHPGAGDQPLLLDAVDVWGRSYRLDENPSRAIRVFVVMGLECPISNGFVPELNRLSREFAAGERLVEFFGVVSDPSVTRDRALRHSEEYAVAFPVLYDASGTLAARLKPTHTPEVFVFDSSGNLRYRGRIDDRYVSLGRRRASPTRRDLAKALAALREGRPVPTERTTPVGCVFEAPDRP